MHAPRADARARTGAYDTRSAASAALVYLARFGGLDELVWAVKNGDQNIKVEAAAVILVSMYGSGEARECRHGLQQVCLLGWNKAAHEARCRCGSSDVSTGSDGRRWPMLLQTLTSATTS